MENYFDIGKIVNTQGIRGDLRIIPCTDDPKRFELLDNIDIFFNEKVLRYPIERVWYHKSFVILKLVGIDDINTAENLRGGVIRIPTEKALPLEADEYYMRDLYDMEVFSGDERLGKITDILQTGANDVYVVKDAKGKEILIPAIKQCIRSISVDENRMQVTLLEGMRE